MAHQIRPVYGHGITAPATEPMIVWGGDSEYRLWIREVDQFLWHDGVERLGSLRYSVACEWRLDVRGASIWPLMVGETGPPVREQCDACVAARLVH